MAKREPTLNLRALLAATLAALTLSACCESDGTGSAAFIPLVCKATAVEPASGIWWNPQESGSGFHIERQGNRLSVGAYVYEDNGAATWYSGIADLQGDGSYTGTLNRYAGGQTLTGSHRPTTSTSAIARMELEFGKDTNGTLQMRREDGSGERTVAIEQFRANGAATLVRSNATFANGTWWNDAESGRGFVIEVQGDAVTFSAFAYRADGTPVWYTGTGTLTNPSQFTVNLALMQGGQTLTGAYRQASTLDANVGAVTFRATGTHDGTLTLPDSREVSIKRLVF